MASRKAGGAAAAIVLIVAGCGSLRQLEVFRVSIVNDTSAPVVVRDCDSYCSSALLTFDLRPGASVPINRAANMHKLFSVTTPAGGHIGCLDLYLNRCARPREDQAAMRLPRPGSRARPPVRRVLTATDRSPTADRAVEWAAEMARRYEAELTIVQVVAADEPSVAEGLTELARAVGMPDARCEAVVDDDPSAAIVRAAEQTAADVLVVGNVGMSGRKEFLLGNVPNRVTHNARCTVVIVNTGGR